MKAALGFADKPGSIIYWLCGLRPSAKSLSVNCLMFKNGIRLTSLRLGRCVERKRGYIKCPGREQECRVGTRRAESI